MVDVVCEVVEDGMTGGCLGSEGAAAWTGRSAWNFGGSGGLLP